VERLLGLMSIDDRDTRGSKLASFHLILLLTIAVHQLGNDRPLQAAILLMCALAGLDRRFRRGSSGVALIVLLVRHVITFPRVSNHSYLEVVLLTLYCWIDDSRDDEQDLFLQACRWLTALIFFYTGVQKLWYGQYFNGRYLAYLAAVAPKTGTAFELLVRPEELARLMGYKREVGSGPFLIDSTFFKLLSNGAWLSEIGLGVALLFRKLWPLAVACAIFTMLVIEFIAREFIFGVLMVSMLFLFTKRDFNRRLLPGYVLFLAYLAAVKLGWVPLLHWV